jgi:hypothetical protein
MTFFIIEFPPARGGREFNIGYAAEAGSESKSRINDLIIIKI